MNKITKNLRENAPDLAEPLFDEAANEVASQLFNYAVPELAKNLPVLKYAMTASDMYSAYKLQSLRKKMKAFLQSLRDGEFDMAAYSSLKDEERAMMIDILVAELDSQTDGLQSEALGLLFVAYVRKNIDWLTFIGIAHELKNINPLLFYFNVDSIQVTEKFIDKNLAVSGPIYYLPPSFYSNGTDKLQFSSSGPFLTDLGKAFYENIYVPMSERYTV